MLSAANSLANILGPVISGIVLPRVDVEFAMLLGTWVVIVVLLVFRWNALYTDKFGQMVSILVAWLVFLSFLIMMFEETGRRAGRQDAIAHRAALRQGSKAREENTRKRQRLNFFEQEAEDAILKRPRALSNSFKDYVEQGLVAPAKTGASIQDFS